MVVLDSVEWPKDGDGARWLPEQRRVYLQGVGQVKVELHREVVGRVKTIQVKRQGRRWMLVLSCDDVPDNPLPATGRPVGIDVGVVSFATTSDGEHIDNPRWGRAAGGLAAAQQRLQRAKRGSKNRQRRRETVAARHRKIANQRKDFHHKQARALVERYDVLAVEDLKIANMVRRAKPVPGPDAPGSYLPNGGRAKSGLNRSISDASWVVSSVFCAPKRKTLGVYGSRSTPGTPRMAARTVDTQHARTASPKQNSSASDAHIAPKQMNTLHVTSYGLDWPFTPTRCEKKLAASSRQRSHGLSVVWWWLLLQLLSGGSLR